MNRSLEIQGKVIVPRGTLITCPNCADEIAEAARDLCWGDRVTESMFIWKNQNFKEGEQCCCKNCHHFWYNGSRLHTERGWS